MGTQRLNRLTFGIFPRLGLLGLLILSLYLMSNATVNSTRFSSLYLILFAVNIVVAFSLLIVILANFIALIRQRRRDRMGSRLTVKLVVIFISLAVAPVSVVYFFSARFISQGIDSWFDVRIEQALQDALDLSRAALDLRMRELSRNLNTAARQLETVSPEAYVLLLSDLRTELDAHELLLVNRRGMTIASSSEDTKAIIPYTPSEVLLTHTQREGLYVGIDVQKDEQLFIRALTSVQVPSDLLQETLFLQGLFSVPEQVSRLSGSVTSAFDEYKQIAYLRQPLKTSFMLTLFLVLLLSLLSAVWGAFYAARRFVSPIRTLVAGTRAISAGDYTHKLPAGGEDELGLLVNSFNTMTRRIARAHEQVEKSQQQAEQERRYLEAILGHLSSGVITTDSARVIRTINQQAETILLIEAETLKGKTLENLASFYSYLEPLSLFLSNRYDKVSDAAEQITLVTDSGRIVLLCRWVPLSHAREDLSGFVLVFDDITGLQQAQRDAAWGEVARRLAHEIKNPLTPIQLSAERLRRRCLPNMLDEDAMILDRSTQTIIQQVDTMKEMVNAFAEYAHAPKINPILTNFNHLVTEVYDLFRHNLNSVRFQLELEPELPHIWIDRNRMRQVLNNLFRNAIDAIHSLPDPQIVVTTQRTSGSFPSGIEMKIRDNGNGFSPEILAHLFEPYTTTKPKGTGLGLAIVKKIIDEHSGSITAENLPAQQGACLTIRLPMIDSQRLPPPFLESF